MFNKLAKITVSYMPNEANLLRSLFDSVSTWSRAEEPIFLKREVAPRLLAWAAIPMAAGYVGYFALKTVVDFTALALAGKGEKMLRVTLANGNNLLYSLVLTINTLGIALLALPFGGTLLSHCTPLPYEERRGRSSLPSSPIASTSPSPEGSPTPDSTSYSDTFSSPFKTLLLSPLPANSRENQRQLLELEGELLRERTEKEKILQSSAQQKALLEEVQREYRSSQTAIQERLIAYGQLVGEVRQKENQLQEISQLNRQLSNEKQQLEAEIARLRNASATQSGIGEPSALHDEERVEEEARALSTPPSDLDTDEDEEFFDVEEGNFSIAEDFDSEDETLE